MIVYNLTIKIDPAIQDNWVAWQKEEHIPEIMSLQLFNSYKFFRLLDVDEEDGITYVIQYTTNQMDFYKRYIEEFASHMREKAFEKWGHRFIAFRTVMQAVH